MSDVTWIVPLGYHHNRPRLVPIDSAALPIWKTCAEDFQSHLRNYVLDQMSIVEETWRDVLSAMSPGSLLSGLIRHSSLVHDLTKTAQHLITLQEILGAIEVAHRIDGLEYQGEPVIDLCAHPDQMSAYLGGESVPVKEYAHGRLARMRASIDRLGLVHEVKTVAIPVEAPFSQGDAFGGILRDLVKPYEVDGWKANVDTHVNHHRISKPDGDGNRTYSVNFHRYVKPPTYPS